MKLGNIRKKIDKEKETDYNNRKKMMLNEIQELVKQYEIDLVPVINYGQTALNCAIAFVDMKGQPKTEPKEEPVEPKIET